MDDNDHWMLDRKVRLENEREFWKFREEQMEMEEKKNRAAVQLGKLGGSVKSDTKKLSSAENGKKGGRPRKDGKPAAKPEVFEQSMNAAVRINMCDKHKQRLEELEISNIGGFDYDKALDKHCNFQDSEDSEGCFEIPTSSIYIALRVDRRGITYWKNDHLRLNQPPSPLP